MNGIDIASYQRGINLHDIDCDFVIVKATQGISYNNPYFTDMVNGTTDSNKLLGVYHYINGAGSEKEMQHFYEIIKPYVNTAIICLDWEQVQNSAWQNLSYLELCVEKIIELTGVKPLIYASKSGYPWNLCKKYDCGTWVAQYADDTPTSFQRTPWNEGAYNCTIRQYSSHGLINGWNGYLDINKAYMTKEAWHKYATSDKNIQQVQEAINIDELVKQTLKGEFGNGATRMVKLGSNYRTVQKRLNEVMKKAKKTKNGAYGNGNTRRKNLGNDYSIVQWIINNKLV